MLSNFFARNVGVVLSKSLALRPSRSSISPVGAVKIINDIVVKPAGTFFTTRS